MSHGLITSCALSYVSPVTPEWWPFLWTWMHEYPECNFDDGSPSTFNEYVAGRTLSAEQGERTWGVLNEDKPVGFLSYQPMTHRTGMTRGICFSKQVHGTGIPRQATAEMLSTLWDEGVEKVIAVYFTHNLRVSAFLRSLGAVVEGELKDQVTQGGIPVAMKMVALFAPRKEGL